MTFDEILTLASKNKKLHKLLKSNEGFYKLFDIIEYNGKWDAEDKSNFDEYVLGVILDNTVELIDVEPYFGKLYNDYNWKNITLSDGRLVFITDENTIYIVSFDNVEDGLVELTVWGLADKIKQGTDVHAMLYGLKVDPNLN